MLTFSATDSVQERWLQRAIGQAGERLGAVRDRLFALAHPQRHHVILDLNAGSGLLTWEAVRQVPEGGVYACVYRETDAIALAEQAIALPELSRPLVLQSDLSHLTEVLTAQAPTIRFDCIIGRNTLMKASDKPQIIQSLLKWLRPNGTITLAEAIPHQAQRLYHLLEPTAFSSKLYKKLIRAEESIYTQPSDPMVNWNAADLQKMFEATGFATTITIEHSSTEILMTKTLINRWFERGSYTQPTYAFHLAQTLSETEITQIHTAFQRLHNQTVNWESAIAFIYAIQNYRGFQTNSTQAMPLE